MVGMNFDRNQIIEEFNLKPTGSKGWMRSNMLVCPNCGQNDEFSIRFTDNGGVLHCLHGKTCNNYSTSLYKYLQHIGKIDLVNYEKPIQINLFPSFKEESEEVEEKLPITIQKPPIGFKRVNSDSYLDGRGLLPEHYELFKIGETRLHPSFKGYIIFQFFNTEGQLVAWVARSKRDKVWHDENLKKHKEFGSGLVLRYKNSPNTDFSRVLGGENEINNKVTTLILVEGLTDKTNVDRQLNLLDRDSFIKCCFTFGNIVSQEQIEIINKYPNIENIYLMYDEGTIEQSKHYGLNLNSTNKEVNVCEIKDRGLDPGGMNVDQICEVLEKAVNSVMFNFSKINGIL